MPNQEYSIHRHESILNNFNFEYVYQYFFGNDKVIEPYKPLRLPNYKERIVTEEASDKTIKAVADKNIFFFDDFSTSAIGKPANNWDGSLVNGKKAMVTQLNGNNDKWLEILAHEKVRPKNIQVPYPQNFTLSYELVASQNFTWGARGLTMQLSKETSPGNAESYLKLKLRPGFDG